MLEIRRREFITLLGGAAAWPLAAWAQQGNRVRRIGVLIGSDENDPVNKTYVSAFTQALTELGWTDGRNVRIDFDGRAVTSIGYERSRRSWSACNPTSSW
jgi:putative ABC transport system substrate-binding protein